MKDIPIIFINVGLPKIHFPAFKSLSQKELEVFTSGNFLEDRLIEVDKKSKQLISGARIGCIPTNTGPIIFPTTMRKNRDKNSDLLLKERSSLLSNILGGMLGRVFS